MGKRLLLADDSITIQKVIGITFANEDYELDIVDNGDAALERARATQPDLILADVYMPGKNGYELCQAVKNDPNLRRIPVLLLAGTFEPFDEDKARQAGADAWIAKPFESQALIDKVEELLAQAAEAPEPEAVVAPEPVAAAEPEPAAEPVEDVVELGDDDIWVDESDLELVEEDFDLGEVAEQPEVAVAGPVEDAAAPAPETAAPAAEPVAESAAAAGSDDDIWGSISFDEEDLEPVEVAEPAETEDVQAVVSQPEVQAETASADAFATEAEDLWQDTEDEIFDLDDVDVIDEEELLSEPEPVSVAAPAAGPQPEATVEPEVAGETAEPEVAESDFDWAGVDLEASEPAFEVPEAAETAASAAAEAAAPVAQPEEVRAEQPAAPEQQVAQQVAALDEAAIEAIVEKVAGRVIEQLAGSVLERIAWEVVPDLAESYIREELRKIREAV